MGKREEKECGMNNSWTLMKGISRDALPKLGNYCFIAYRGDYNELIAPNMLYKFKKSHPWSEEYAFVSVESGGDAGWDEFYHKVNEEDIVAFCVVERPKVTEEVIREWEKLE